MFVRRPRQRTDDRESCGPIGGRLSCIYLAYGCSSDSRRYIHFRRCSACALSPLVHQVSPGLVLAARWENVFKYTRETTRCDGDVFPPCYQSLRPASRRRENLPLGVHASAASSRGRVGIAYLLVPCAGLEFDPKPGPQLAVRVQARPRPAIIFQARPRPTN